jgi:hypothetical protein
MSGGLHNVGGPGVNTTYQDKGVGLSTQFSGAVGGRGGHGATGHARNYMGTTYAEKPSFKKLLSDPTAYAKQSALFREQRVAKHRDRLLEELAKPTPDVGVVKSTIKKLATISNHHPFRFAPTIPDAGPQRTAMGQQWTAVLKGIATVMPKLPPNYQANLKHIENSATNVDRRIKDVTALESKAKSFTSTGLSELHDPTKHTTYSTNGGGGTMLMRTGQGGPLTTVLKIDHADGMANAANITKMLQYVATHSDVGLPFDFATHEVIKASQGDVAATRAMLVGFKTACEQRIAVIGKDTTNSEYNYLAQRVGSLKDRIDFLDSDGLVLKQSALPGTEANSGTLTERIARCNDPTFAETCGMMLLLAPMFGMRDHIALNGAGYNNLANFMYDPTTKRLAVIDLAAKEHGTAKASRIGTDAQPYCSGPLKELVKELHAIAKSGTGNNLGAKLLGMNSMQVGAPDMFLVGGFTNAGYMFSPSEQTAVNDPVNGVDKNKFAGNFFRGIVRAIDYIERNADVFAEAHTQMGNGWQPQEVHDIVSALGALGDKDRQALLALSHKT